MNKEDLTQDVVNNTVYTICGSGSLNLTDDWKVNIQQGTNNSVISAYVKIIPLASAT